MSARRLIWILLAGLTMSAQAEGLSLTVHLVPESHWQDGTPDAAGVLEEGEVFLYREGEYEPAHRFKANAPARVPPGTWVWIAEAPGFVSINTGVLKVPEEGSLPPKKLVWPVVPACEVVLTEDPLWARTERLDTVALDRGAVFPLNPRGRKQQWIPAGSFLQYRTGSRGLAAIGDIQRCRAGESVAVRPPAAPAGHLQDVLVRIKMPLEGLAKPEDFVLVLEARKPGSERMVGPSALIWQGRIGSFFFLDVPVVDAAWRLTARHPELRSIRQDVASLGGGATELPAIEMQERFALDLTVDYQPARRHEMEVLYVEHCGRQRQLMGPQRAQTCRPLQQELPLREGLYTYRFENLDDGLHWAHARIDQEKVVGLGSYVQVFLEDGFDSTLLETVTLREMEIHGHLLRDGEPVAGEVRLRLSPMDSETLPVRRFRTDEDLLYHLYYFGALPHPQAVHNLPETMASRDPEALRGLYWTYGLAACDDDDWCRNFKLYSILVGEGRLDLPLGGQEGLTLEVVDQESGKELSGALVLYGRGAPELHFYDGEVHWHDPIGQEAIGSWTDSGGLVHILDLPSGKQFLSIGKEGYRGWGRELVLAEGERRTIRAALKRDAGRNGLVFNFPDGQPVANAVIRGYRRGADGNLACMGRTTATGILSVANDCLADDSNYFLLLHRNARISAFSASALRQVSEIEVSRGAVNPVRIQLRTEEGQPVPFFPVRLRYPTFTLDTNDLLAAASAGQDLFYLSDPQGELVLRGVDPDAPVLPMVEADHGGLRGRLSLVGAAPETPMVLVVR